MSKYQTNIDFSTFEVYTHLTDYIRAVQRLLNSEYYYYSIGKLKLEKVSGLLEKLDQIYELSETSLDKKRRYELDQPTVVIRFFTFGTDEIFFILMAREGNKGSKKQFFFEREKYKDARIKEQRLSVLHYEFLRINKEAYAFMKDGKEIKVDAKNEVWTLQLTHEYKEQLKSQFKKYALRRDVKELARLGQSITKLIGFNKVREDYKRLKDYFESTVLKIRKSDPKYPVKLFSDVAKIPDNLGYCRPNHQVEKIELKLLLA